MFLKDPSTDKKSVSLTLLVVSFIAVMVAGSLQLLGKTNSVSLFPEVLYSMVALYFGRRFSVNGKSFSSDSTEEKKEKSE